MTFLRPTLLPILLAAASFALADQSSARSPSQAQRATPIQLAEAAPATPVRVVVSFLNSIPAMAAVQVAYKRGYFKDAGLDLTFASAIGGGDTLRPLTTGDADIAIGSPAASTLAALKNPEIKIAAIWLPYNAFYFIGTKPLPQTNGAVLGGSVGASTVNLLIGGLAEKMAVKLETQRAGTGSMADNWDAVRAGHLQASWALEPFITQKKESDGAQVVLEAAQYIPYFPSDFVVVNEKFATSHADAMKGFFVGIERIFSEFTDPAKQGALAKDLATVMVFSEPVIQKSLSTDSAERLAKTYTLKMNMDALGTTSHLMEQAKLIHEPVDWKKLIDQSFLPARDQAADLR